MRGATKPASIADAAKIIIIKCLSLHSSTSFAVKHTGAVPGLGNASSTWLATAATVKVYVGGQQPGMAVKAPSNVLSAEIEVAGKEVPLSAC